MSDFVKINLPGWLRAGNIESEILSWRDEALAESGKILESESQASVRERFYRTGAALASLQNQTIGEGSRKSYEEFSELFYFRFGEYGTGRRGRASGVPHPASYRYGSTPGMAARFMLGHAIEKSRQLVISEFTQFAKRLPGRIQQ